MEETLQIASSPVVWVLALSSIAVVLLQTWIYYRMARTYVRDTDVLSPEEVRRSLKVGTIATAGPAVAVFTIAVVLIGLIGAPITLSRVGVIGSAAFESLTSAAGSGYTVGTPDFTPTLLATAAWVMALGGSGWLISTILLTKGLDTTQQRLSKSNPLMIKLIGAVAPFVVFFTMGWGEVRKTVSPAPPASPTYGVLAALIVGAAAMWFFMWLSRQHPKWKWLAEWSMGFAIVLAMVVGAVVDG
ncbi:MAG: DUF5058 family protein [Actinomycetales bacterium]|jgi:hypothetical protein|nr:DUF5058 family protein [Actinomycetales bacterium]